MYRTGIEGFGVHICYHNLMRKIERDIVGSFIFSNDGYLLLGKSRKGGVYKDLWIVPGGGIEPGETELEAVCRETLEEVGIDITKWKIEKMDVSLSGESEKVLRDTGEKVLVHMQFYNYIVQAPDSHDDIHIQCEDDIVEAAWHPLQTLQDLDMSPPTCETLKKLGFIK